MYKLTDPDTGTTELLTSDQLIDRADTESHYEQADTDSGPIHDISGALAWLICAGYKVENQ